MLSIRNVSKQFVEKLFFTADNIHLRDKNSLAGKTLINAFFEPSTRTSLSFESAMYKMGGNVITFNKDVSSVKKGESFEDTIRTLSLYGDAMVIRHPEKGLVEKASNIIDIPVINGGDGDGEHPTQALLDLYTIYKSFPTLENLKILFVGDVKHSRTINSLIDILQFYPTNKLFFLPFENREPSSEFLYTTGIAHSQIMDNMLINKIDLDISFYDVIYCTRLQKERSDKEDSKVDIIIDKNMVNSMKDTAIIMHPLPRNEEIHPIVDNDKRCKYFDQMKYGLDIRMALLHELIKNQ
jgi:aspartate carbamoyltransferase